MVLVAVGAVVVIAYAMRPAPLPVEVQSLRVAPLEVSVEEEGETRIKERYVVSAPLTGRLRRITLDPGDPVVAGETVLAVIDPSDPELLDARAIATAEARVLAAEAAVHQAEASVRQADARVTLAEAELERVQTATARGAATSLELEAAQQERRAEMEAYRAAQFAADIARFELEQARSALLHAQGESTEAGRFRFVIRAPITGRTLRVLQESDAVVGPGTPLVEVGDPTDLELVVDVLSTDAVRIQPGDEVEVLRWGGPRPLRARVRVIEPAAFTKVSALGVEEQRVNIVCDFESPVSEREALGDGYRATARIVIWSSAGVLQVPMSAMFREGESWAVFVVDAEDRVASRRVTPGQRNAFAAEVREGLEVGDRVVLYPSDAIEPGMRVAPTEVAWE